MAYITIATLLSQAKPAVAGQGLCPAEAELLALIVRKGEVIDGYCRDRYEVPFVVVPTIVAEVCLALSLADVLPAVFHNNDAQVARAGRFAKWAQDQLDRIQQHKLSLVAEDEAAAGMGGKALGTAAETDAIFTIEEVW